jgi:hypothetical protein
MRHAHAVRDHGAAQQITTSRRRTDDKLVVDRLFGVIELGAVYARLSHQTRIHGNNKAQPENAANPLVTKGGTTAAAAESGFERGPQRVLDSIGPVLRRWLLIIFVVEPARLFVGK